jgi:hypothetical protein
MKNLLVFLLLSGSAQAQPQMPSPPQTELRAYDEHHLVLLHRLMQFQKPPAPDVRRPAS